MKLELLAAAAVLSLAVSLVLGILIIPILRRLKFGQNVRTDGPKTHLAKQGTPTMGGIIFAIPLILIPLIFARGSYEFLLPVIMVTLGFGLIGFIDDYIKVVMKRSLGLRAYQKIIGQVGISVILAYYAYSNSNIGTGMLVPFTSWEWDLGIFYIPITVFIIIGTVNSVNLTDGLDGLAGTISLIFSITLCIIIYFTGRSADGIMLENYRNLAFFAAAMIGALLGFLKYNAYPAKVIMGDTGAFVLGGALTGLTIVLRLPLFIPIMGGIFFAEAVSDILQVGSYKLRGKRIFRMAPLHHHFELSGMHETKVVMMFAIVTVILNAITLIAI